MHLLGILLFATLLCLSLGLIVAMVAANQGRIITALFPENAPPRLAPAPSPANDHGPGVRMRAALPLAA